MFRASLCPSSGDTIAVAASGLQSELGDSSAVVRRRAGCGGSERVNTVQSPTTGPTTTKSTADNKLRR
jgi:hypothetical protein